MNEELNKMINNRKLVTFRVTGWIGVYTKGEICEILKFSRPTLDRRMNLHNWKLKEIKTVIKHIPF